jgi:short-subunit dehydrogenase
VGEQRAIAPRRWRLYRGGDMGDWVLITGASAGIGQELARVFAEHGYNLVLLARDADALSRLAKELETSSKIQARALPQDLAQPGAASRVFQSLRDTPISVLVNNAGFGGYGAFADSSLALCSEMMQVNMVALVELTHLFLQPMRERNRGRILNVASTAAFQPGPTMNIYYATKAFVYSFSYALAVELRASGITVTTVCPGLTRSRFFTRAKIKMEHSWAMMESRTVAEAGYRGLLRGQRVVIPGWMNKATSFLARRAPPRLTSAIVRRIHSKAPAPQ